MSKISLVSLGCPKNLVDSENLLKKLAARGLSYTEDPEQADLLLINTCGFIDAAKKESIEEILRLTAAKESGKKKLVVFGCLAKRYGEELKQEIPEIDVLYGVGDDEKIVDYCVSVLPAAASAEPDVRLADTAYAYLKIAEGCDRGCSYCVIPDIRGGFHSSAPEDILKEAEALIRAGRRELIIVAQDITSYGKDLAQYDLSRLIKDIASISGDFWIRLLYLYPTAITDELLETIAAEKKVCKYLDIPLQHTEEKILGLMKRGGGRQYYEKLIKKIRTMVPDVALRSTLITGFPQETQEDFESMLDFVRRMELDRLGVFTYSREEGSAAYALKGQVPKHIRAKRRDRIMEVQSAISLERNKMLVGRVFRALVDEMDGDVGIGRIYSQAPEIDGVVFLKGDGVGKHEFVNVRIDQAFDYDLQGTVVG
ncbi:MAG: 30S ribosomal protein S12 methylthiotransferase RimO [Nitrospirae bacterium]|nr:30S ribosomal protein S12 methylthiotransferase RimO [Nitrospirota bacterium]